MILDERLTPKCPTPLPPTPHHCCGLAEHPHYRLRVRATRERVRGVVDNSQNGCAVHDRPVRCDIDVVIGHHLCDCTPVLGKPSVLPRRHQRFDISWHGRL